MRAVERVELVGSWLHLALMAIYRPRISVMLLCGKNTVDEFLGIE